MFEETEKDQPTRINSCVKGSVNLFEETEKDQPTRINCCVKGSVNLFEETERPAICVKGRVNLFEQRETSQLWYLKEVLTCLNRERPVSCVI